MYFSSAAATLAAAIAVPSAYACSRVLENKYETVVTGRSLDWAHHFDEVLNIHPRGEEMDGIMSPSVKWVSKYASVTASITGLMEKIGIGPGEVCEGTDLSRDGATDGMNEAGLGAHLLYLGEEDGTVYAEPSATDEVNLSYMRWARYLLDNFATVQEAVDGMKEVKLVKANLCFKEGQDMGLHVAIEDATGDSAVFEHVGGELQVYHGRNITVMTNEPSLDQQWDFLKQFSPWGGDKALPANLPGSIASSDRFVRLKYYLQTTPVPENEAEAVAYIKSLIASTNVPFGAPYETGPGETYPTWWETVLDHTNKAYYFGWLLTPNIIYLDYEKIDAIGAFDEGKPHLRLRPQDTGLAGDVLCKFTTVDGQAPEGCESAVGGDFSRVATY